GHRLVSAQLGHELLVGVEIGEDDDLADLGVLVARRASGAESAPPAGRSAGAPADVALAEIALGESFLLGGAGVDEGQGDAGLALLDVDPTRDRSDGAAPAAEVAEDSAGDRPDVAAARIFVGADDVGLEEIIGRLDLAGAHVRPALKLA